MSFICCREQHTFQRQTRTRTQYIRWQWRHFLMPYLCQPFFSHYVWGKLCETFVRPTVRDITFLTIVIIRTFS